ncbi:MAG: hypothetical protein Q9182_004974 [Xanthomendoza sp. 2 TL-2023]
MKSTISFLPLLISGVTSSEVLSCFSGHGRQAILNDIYLVPGGSGITFCDNPDKYSLKIKEAHLNPYYVSFDADLNFTDKVEKATVKQSFKFSSMPNFPPVEATTDLCTSLGIIDVHCPVQGPAKISQKNFLLPLLLKGENTIKVEVLPEDKNKKPITCLEATLKV